MIFKQFHYNYTSHCLSTWRSNIFNQHVERIARIELALLRWQHRVLPLNYIRKDSIRTLAILNQIILHHFAEWSRVQWQDLTKAFTCLFRSAVTDTLDFVRIAGIEPTPFTWKANILPLKYIHIEKRLRIRFSMMAFSWLILGFRYRGYQRFHNVPIVSITPSNFGSLFLMLIITPLISIHEEVASLLLHYFHMNSNQPCEHHRDLIPRKVKY